MDDKFFALPAQKQQAIVNAGYRVFAQNSYKKAPMLAIAQEAGVSKSLLFHYFRNKKELYLYLFRTAAQTTEQALTQAGCYRQTDLFEMLALGMQVKLELMHRQPAMGRFAMRAFYEKDPAVCGDIQRCVAEYVQKASMPLVLGLDPDTFIPGLDLQMAYRNMYWAAAGCVWELEQQGQLDLEQVRATFRQLVAHWRQIYLRRP